MSLRDCLQSAVEQGAINQRQADELNAYYEARFRKNRASMSEREAMEAARREVSEDLRAQAARKRRNALLAEAKRRELAARVANHRTAIRGKASPLDAVLTQMIDYGTSGTSSMKGRENAILSLAMRDLAEPIARFRTSNLTGRRMNRADLADVVRALWNEGDPSPEVRAMADGLRNVLEDFRQRFNAAGGNIPKREYYDVPHTHNARKMLKLADDPDAARQQWKAFVRPLLDPERMTYPATGETVGEAGIDAALDHAWASIVSDGWAHRAPQGRPFGQGALSERYQDARFLEFRNADAWLAYNDRFGEKDVVGTIFGHLQREARDIAAMEIFGPNPDATVEWLKQMVQIEAGKGKAGLPSLYRALPGMDAGKYADWRISSLWRTLRGQERVLSAPARFADDVRNAVTAALLGATGILAAATDPFIAVAARMLAGLPIMKGQMRFVKELAAEFANGEAGRKAALRKGILWEDFLHAMHDEARFIDQVMGHEWTRWLVDRALTWNALKPLTAARKRLEAGAWHETLGGFAEKGLDWIDLPKLMQRTMAGFGFTAEDWAKMRGGVDAMGFLDPVGVLDRTGDRALAERYAEMIAQWGERSVPSVDPRIKSIVTGKAERGTPLGEVAQFATQFMSFSMSFTARQMEAVFLYAMAGNSRGTRILRGAGYFAVVSSFLMIGAGIYRQAKAVLDGKDPEDMQDPKFWAQAFVQGGGGGIFADFVASSEDRFGGSIKDRLAGPGGGFISDTLGLTLGNIYELMQGEDTHAGRDLARYVGRYTPVLSSHPATRLWYRRAVVDTLQWMLDPDADKSFKAQKRRASYWSPPGEGIAPRRAPDWQTAWPG